MSEYRQPAPLPRAEEPVASNLGDLRSTHAGPTLLRALFPAIATTALLLAMGAYVAADLGARVMAAFAPCAVILFVLLAWTPLRRGRYAIALHQHGIVVIRKDATLEIPFADVDEVWFDLSVTSILGGTHEVARLEGVRLVTRNGPSHLVPAPSPDVAQTILRHCTTPLLAEARRALAAGETLTFANVTLTQNMITIGGVTRGWDSIRLVRFQAGRVAFFTRSKIFPWKTVRLDRIPHPTLFTKLVGECARKTESDDYQNR